MNFQFYQLITIAVYIALAVCIWQFKNKWVRVFLVALASGLFLINPIMFKQEGISKIERRAGSINVTLPEKVIVESKTFVEKQSEQMQKLKTQSKECVKNEIN